MHRISVLAGIAILASLPAFAQPDFSGNWLFNASKSQNIGMMSEMKLVATVKQNNDLLVITNATVFNGKEGTSEIRLDLTGKPVPNKNPMEAPAETVTKWDGNKLVTTWTSPGSVAGSASVRIETRYLSGDGKVLTVESGRGKRPQWLWSMTVNEHVSPLALAGTQGVPHADLPRSRRAGPWLFLILFVGAGSTGAIYYWRTSGGSVAPISTTHLVRPEMREVNASVVATGTIRLRTGAEVRVGTQISGIVTRLNVTVGSHIRKGEVIAEIESRGLQARIAQAKSQIEVDQTSLRKTEQDLHRSHQLLEAQLIARQQTEDLEQDLKSAQARLDKSRSDLTVVESDLPYLTIRAPIAGTIASVSTQQGETVAASFSAPTFVTIIEDNSLELIAMIDETDIGGVRPSNPVVFTTETFPSLEFRGVVERVAPKATIISGVVNYETGIAIQTGSSVLKPDMTANVTISTARRKALMVPIEALHQKGDERFVYIQRNGLSEKRAVVPGQRHGAWNEINSGLSVNEVVFAGDPPVRQGGQP